MTVYNPSTGGGGTPAGSLTNLQFNDSGSFGGLLNSSAYSSTGYMSLGGSVNPYYGGPLGALTLTGPRMSTVLPWFQHDTSGAELLTFHADGETGAEFSGFRIRPLSGTPNDLELFAGRLYFNAYQLYFETNQLIQSIGFTGNPANAITIPDGTFSIVMQNNSYAGALVTDVGNAAVLTWDASMPVKINPYDASTVGFQINARTGQTANLYEINSFGNTGGDLLNISSSGYLGLGTNTPLARLHSVGGSSTIVAPSLFSAILVPESLIGTPTDTVSLIYGPQDSPSGGSSQNLGITGYIANGQTINANVYSYRILGGIKYAGPSSLPISFTDSINDGTTDFGIDWSWTVATNGDGSVVDGYVIQTGASTYDVGNTTSYQDTNSGGSDPIPSPFTSSFTSAGQTFNFDSYGIGISPSSVTYYAGPNSTSITDSPANGTLFWISHTIYGTLGNNWRSIQDFSSGFDGTSDQTYYQTSNYAGSGTNSPNHYGILSDGSSLNLDFRSYSRETTPGIYYSSGHTDGSVSDPNNGSYYTISITQTFTSSGTKILKQINGGGYTTGYDTAQTAFEIDAFGPSFSSGVVVLPSSLSSSSIIAENGATDLDPMPQLILKSNDISGHESISFSQNGSEVGRILVNATGDMLQQILSSKKLKIMPTFGGTMPEIQYTDSTGNNAFASMSTSGQMALNRSILAGGATLALGAADSSNTQILFDSSASRLVTNGGMAWNGQHWFGTDNSVDRQFIRGNGTANLTIATIPIATSNGFLIDGPLDVQSSVILRSNLTFLMTQGASISSGQSFSMGAGSQYLGGIRTTFATRSTSGTLSVANNSPITVFTGSTASQILTLPPAASISGTVFEISNEASVSVTIATTSSQNMNLGLGTQTTLVLQSGDRAKFIATASSTWDVTSYTQWITPVANGGTGQTTPVVIANSFSGVGTATTVFTVTIGTTQANNTYKVIIEPTNLLACAVQYVTNKTTTTFDVTYIAGLTGTVTFDWSLFT